MPKFQGFPFVARLLLAALCGSLLPLAFAPFFIWPLAIVLPALLFFLVEPQAGRQRVFILGWLFGIGYFGFGVYWTYNSLHDFGNASPIVAGTLSALLIAVMAIFPALTVSAWIYLKRRIGDRSIWALPLLWFCFEWAKGWFLTGLPWLSLGYSQTESPLGGFAPIVGVYGVGAICVLLAVALLRILKARSYRLISLWVIILGFGLGLQSIEWTEQLDSPIKITIVQGNIPQEVKWQYQQRQNIFNTYWRETSQHWDSDLIVWPETALPGRSEDLAQTVLKSMSEKAVEQGSSILTGIVVSESANEIYYNSMLLLGTNQGLYHKRHLVAFGEYFPLRRLLDFMRGMIDIPYSDLSSGSLDQPQMVVGNLVLGVSICFEDVFSREIMLAMPEANILVNASNDAWFGDSLAPHQHLQIAQMRALETGRALVRSTNTGVSAFIDHQGRIISQSTQFKTESITQSVHGRTGNTPFYYFSRVQDWLALLMLGAFIVFMFRSRAQKTG